MFCIVVGVGVLVVVVGVVGVVWNFGDFVLVICGVWYGCEL